MREAGFAIAVRYEHRGVPPLPAMHERAPNVTWIVDPENLFRINKNILPRTLAAQ